MAASQRCRQRSQWAGLQAVLHIAVSDQLQLINVRRTLQGSPLALSGVRLMLPQPEFDYLAASARTASAFVVELLGKHCRQRCYVL
jgi:hypothetical protein